MLHLRACSINNRFLTSLTVLMRVDKLALINRPKKVFFLNFLAFVNQMRAFKEVFNSYLLILRRVGVKTDIDRSIRFDFSLACLIYDMLKLLIFALPQAIIYLRISV